jgi:hypothetical protein
MNYCVYCVRQRGNLCRLILCKYLRSFACIMYYWNFTANKCQYLNKEFCTSLCSFYNLRFSNNKRLYFLWKHFMLLFFGSRLSHPLLFRAFTCRYVVFHHRFSVDIKLLLCHAMGLSYLATIDRCVVTSCSSRLYPDSHHFCLLQAKHILNRI